MIDLTYNPIIPADYKSRRERTSLRSLSLRGCLFHVSSIQRRGSGQHHQQRQQGLRPVSQAAAQIRRGAHSASALPVARSASSVPSSGASQQVTLSHTRFTPASAQSFSQERIHSPSPQP